MNGFRTIRRGPKIGQRKFADLDGLRQAGAAKKLIPARKDACLVTIQAGQGHLRPISCVPGAGANIAVFTHMATALGSQWPIHGLRMRGSNHGDVPHSTVLAAARTYLRAIDDAYPEGPLHLLGHSFGGWVVFEMALRLRTAGRQVASVTLNRCRGARRQWHP